MIQAMRQAGLTAITIASLFAAGQISATTYYWNNSQSDNDFANFNNWDDGASGVPTVFTSTDILEINLNGADKSIASSAATVSQIQVGRLTGSDGELDILAGADLTTSLAYMGRGGNDTGGTSGTINMSGGSVQMSTYTTTGYHGSTGTLNISGGTWHADRMTNGNTLNSYGYVNLSGTGSMIFDNYVTSGSGGNFYFKMEGSNASFSADRLTIKADSVSIMFDFVLDGANGVGTGMQFTNNIYIPDVAKFNVSFLGAAAPGTYTLMTSQLGAFTVEDFSNDLLTDDAVNAGWTYAVVEDGGMQKLQVTLAGSYHPGDANGDGIVNLADLQILGDNWQSTTATWATADFTGDGNVNLADLQILGDNWGYGLSSDLSFGEALGQVAIPEPATCGLLAIGGMLALRRRR